MPDVSRTLLDFALDTTARGDIAVLHFGLLELEAVEIEEAGDLLVCRDPDGFQFMAVMEDLRSVQQRPTKGE